MSTSATPGFPGREGASAAITPPPRSSVPVHSGRAESAGAWAPFGRRLLTVSGMEDLGAYRLLKVADPGGPPPVPGQFAMLAAAERWGGGEDERPYLPRAFSIADWQSGEALFLLEDVGPGSKRLCELRAGDGVWLLGPLGRGFSPPGGDAGRPILVGGGAGIAPLAILQNSFDRDPRGVPAVVLLGFRDRAHAEGARLLRRASVTTEDGSAGSRGRVDDLLVCELDKGEQSVVYACGPAAMLEAVRALCTDRGVPAELALEAPMACGFGACYGCVVALRDGSYLRLCLDGPVLDAAMLERVDAHAGAPG